MKKMNELIRYNEMKTNKQTKIQTNKCNIFPIFPNFVKKKKN